MTRALRRGRHTARFAAEMLPAKLHEDLTRMKYLADNLGPWVRELPDDRHMTHVLDLLELYELEVLLEVAKSSGHLICREDSASVGESA